MQIRILTEYQDVEPYLDSVCNLADKNRDSLGFLPASAYRELAVRGRLWPVIDQNSAGPLGYLMFGGRYPHIRVFQLFVTEGARKHGVGKQLISTLKDTAGRWAVQTITARVAADLPANAFWERQGFRLIRQEKGGETTDRVINIRAFEVPYTSLWATC